MDFAFSHIDFEALYRSLGLHTEWFEPTLPKSTEVGLQEGVPPGQVDLHVSTDSASEKKPAGPTPFTSRLIGRAAGIGFSQGEQQSLISPFLLSLSQYRKVM